MQDRLTIDRPVALGTALAEAVRSVCDRRLSLAAAELALLDARLMCGDFEGVLDLLRTAAPSPALPLIVARYVLWSGDLHSAAAAWSHVIESLEPGFTQQLEPPLRRASFTAIASTATDLGDAALAARLLGLARQLDDAQMPAGGYAGTDIDRDARMVSDMALNKLGMDPDAARGRLRLRPRMDEMDELSARNIRFGDGSVRIRAVREHDVLTIRVEQDAGSIPFTLLLEPFVRQTGPATIDGQPADLVPRTADTDPPDQASSSTLHWGSVARVAGAVAAGSGALAAGSAGAGALAGGPGAGPEASFSGTIIPVQLVLDEVRTLTIRESGAQRQDEKKGPVT